MCSWTGRRTGRGCQFSSFFFSATSQATGPACSLGVCPPLSLFLALSQHIISPRARRGDCKGGKKNPTTYFQVIPNWKSQFLCLDGRENEPSNTINS